MKFAVMLAIGLCVLSASGPAAALPDGKELLSDCSRGDAFSKGYCEGYIIGVLSAHMSPWVINLQKGRTYFCIPGNLTYEDITKAVKKYIADNPKRRRYRADINIWTAATEAYPCPDR